MTDYVEISDAGMRAIEMIAKHWSARVDFTVSERQVLNRCIQFVVDDICADNRLDVDFLARLEEVSDELHKPLKET